MRRHRHAHLLRDGGQRTLCGLTFPLGSVAHVSRGLCSTCARLAAKEESGWMACWDGDGNLLPHTQTTTGGNVSVTFLEMTP